MKWVERCYNAEPMRRILIILLVLTLLHGFVALAEAQKRKLPTVWRTPSPSPTLTPTPTSTIAKVKIEYALPFPGLLPDHPLYIFKVLRDRIVVIFTRDPRQKVALFVHLADKRLAMGERLIERKKEVLAAETISKGEKYLLGAVEILREMTEAGDRPAVGLVNQVQMSVNKHREVIAELHQRVSGQAQSSMGLSLQLGADVDEQLKVFKQSEDIGM